MAGTQTSEEEGHCLPGDGVSEVGRIKAVFVSVGKFENSFQLVPWD